MSTPASRCQLGAKHYQVLVIAGISRETTLDYYPCHYQERGCSTVTSTVLFFFPPASIGQSDCSRPPTQAFRTPWGHTQFNVCLYCICFEITEFQLNWLELPKTETGSPCRRLLIHNLSLATTSGSVDNCNLTS